MYQVVVLTQPSLTTLTKGGNEWKIGEIVFRVCGRVSFRWC